MYQKTFEINFDFNYGGTKMSKNKINQYRELFNNKYFLYYLIAEFVFATFLFLILPSEDITDTIDRIIFIVSNSLLLIFVLPREYLYRDKHIIPKISSIKNRILFTIFIIVIILRFSIGNNIIIDMILGAVLCIIVTKVMVVINSEKYKDSAIKTLISYYLIFFFSYLIFANLYTWIIKPCINNYFLPDGNRMSDMYVYVKGYLLPFIGSFLITLSALLSFSYSYKNIYQENKSKVISRKWITIYEVISILVLFASITFKFLEHDGLTDDYLFKPEFVETNFLRYSIMIFIVLIKRYYNTIMLLAGYMFIFLKLHAEKEK